MGYPTRPFVVLGADRQVLGDLPTPRLISEGGGEAYEADGVWRARDDNYDPAGTEYSRVIVAHRPECQGHADLPMPHLVEWGAEIVGGRCAEHRGR